MISRLEFMAGSVALAASSASTRLAPGPESIWINDVHSQWVANSESSLKKSAAFAD